MRWRGRQPVAAIEGRGRPRVLRVAALAVALTAAGWAIFGYLREVPKVEPPFERIVGTGAGPVKEFALRDSEGRMHTSAEWSGQQAAVLFFVTSGCRPSRESVPEMERLALAYAPRGIVFYAVDPDPVASTGSKPREDAAIRLPFPRLLDPARRIIRQAGAAVTPQAVVLLPDGQVIYRGAVAGGAGSAGAGRGRRSTSDLEAALEAILQGLMPVVTETPVVGTPIGRVGTGDGERDEPITFNKHVAPILWNNCARCHRPGEVGPFSLLSYRDAAKRGDFIREVTATGQMPPWKAHPGAGVFLDAPRLSVLEKETIARWVEAGCEEGDPADLPPLPRFPDGWQLGPPDLVLTMPEPLDLPAGGNDMYRAFDLPVPLDRDVTITGVEFHPGNRRIVHHSRIHFDQTGDARRRERDDPGPGFAGWKGRSVLELPYPGLGGWTPGMTPRFAPAGAGSLLPRGSDIVLQIHYHPSGKAEFDRSSVGLYLSRDPVKRRMAGLSISTDRIDIPAGARRQAIIQAARLRADVRLYTVVPHAHYLCREFRLAATLPDGTQQPLLWINDWNLDWQDQYRYARPVRLPKGTILTLAAYFDNTEDNPRNPNRPPRRVRYGVESHDEMCACHLEFLPEDAAGYEAYPNKSPFGL